MAAEAQGIFRTPPEVPYYLLKAGHTSDDPPLEHAAMNMETPVQQVEMEAPEPQPLATAHKVPFQDLRTQMRDHMENKDILKMTRLEMEDYLEGANVVNS